MDRCTETSVGIRGCNLHVRRGGAGNAMLYLHGASGVPGWMPAFQALSDHFDLWVPDHPTFGRSDGPDWLDDMNDLAMFYLDFLDDQDLTDIHLVGNSLGGWLALEIAVRNSTRLKSMTIVGSAGIRIKGKPIVDIFMMDPEDLTRELYLDQSYAEAILSAEPTEEQVDIQLRNRVSTARLGWQPRLFNPALRKWIHRVKVPTHVIWGDTDRIVDPAYAEEFGRLIEGSEVTIIGSAGHLPQIEQPDAFAEAVKEFIDRRT